MCDLVTCVWCACIVVYIMSCICVATILGGWLLMWHITTMCLYVCVYMCGVLIVIVAYVCMCMVMVL